MKPSPPPHRRPTRREPSPHHRNALIQHVHPGLLLRLANMLQWMYTDVVHCSAWYAGAAAWWWGLVICPKSFHGLLDTTGRAKHLLVQCSSCVPEQLETQLEHALEHHLAASQRTGLRSVLDNCYVVSYAVKYNMFHRPFHPARVLVQSLCDLCIRGSPCWMLEWHARTAGNHMQSACCPGRPHLPPPQFAHTHL